MSQGPELFDRLPPGLFAPLAGEHAPRYARILTHLYSDFFGPDGEPPRDEGFPKRLITDAIEGYVSADPWPTQSGEDRSTSAQGHSHEVYRRLVDTGWLDEEQPDLRWFVSMKPAVHQFLALLVTFAERGPSFINGAVQVIYNHLREVVANPASQAPGFHEAARTVSTLIDMLAATRLHAREAMERLGQQTDVSTYTREYFEDYVSRVYIADYHEVRNANHPLHHRYEILGFIDDLQSSPSKRAALLGWYRDNARQLRTDDPELALARDFARFTRLHRIEEHLDRLDSAINRVNRQALSYLQYATRSRGVIDALLASAIETTRAGGAVSLPVFVGLPFSETRLRPAREAPQQQERIPLQARQLSPETRALRQLTQVMRLNRELRLEDIETYIDRHRRGRDSITSDDLTISSIKDLCAFLALGRFAARGDSGASKSVELPRSRYRIRHDGGGITSNPYVETSQFVIELITLVSKRAG